MKKISRPSPRYVTANNVKFIHEIFVFYVLKHVAEFNWNPKLQGIVLVYCTLVGIREVTLAHNIIDNLN